MKIAVTAARADLEAKVDPRFGRSPYFLFVETDTMDFEAVENPNLALGGGAGIQSAQFVAERGVKAVLTGNCGPNAYQTLTAAGVQVIVGANSSVREAVEKFKSGGFETTSGPNVEDHFGAGGNSYSGNPGGGFGRGMGRGMGRGGGRGYGMGMGRGLGRMSSGAWTGGTPTQPGQRDDLETLRAEARAMEEERNRLMERIHQLETGKVTRVIARIDQKKCVGCEVCVPACPPQAIRMEGGKALVNFDGCTSCGRCVDVCPTGAISMG